jgi:hypothetical protein
MSVAEETSFGLDNLHSSSYLRVEADCEIYRYLQKHGSATEKKGF